MPLARSASVALLVALSIATGLLGVQNVYANFNMTFFWIVFVLGVPVMRWRCWATSTRLSIRGRRSASGIEALTRRTRLDGRHDVARPRLLPGAPSSTWRSSGSSCSPIPDPPRGAFSLALAGFLHRRSTCCTWPASEAVRSRHGEFFGVMLAADRQDVAVGHGRGTPHERAGWNGPRRWRAPFIGLLRGATASHPSLLLFILFMLSSTAFDGLHATQAWTQPLFWKNLYPLLKPLFTTAPGQKYAFSTKLYYAWQWVSLLISPFVYLAVFVGFVGLMLRRWSAANSRREDAGPSLCLRADPDRVRFTT